jgi:hypothetical protein
MIVSSLFKNHSFGHQSHFVDSFFVHFEDLIKSDSPPGKARLSSWLASQARSATESEAWLELTGASLI